MKRLVALLIGLLILVPATISLTDVRRKMPPVERLGYLPSFEVAYFSSLEYRLLLSEYLFLESIFYYGDMLDRPAEKPDYRRIYQYIATSTRLNPYNIDAYYFGEAILTWDAHLIKEMNSLLEVGVAKRNWDYYLPFFLGFNYSYFLNDFEKGAKYMALAGKLNPAAGEGFMGTLAGRLYYQADKTEMAVDYLRTLYQGARNPTLRQSIHIRLDALEKIAALEQGVRLFKGKRGRPPADLQELIRAGIIPGVPEDPYGGRFFLDPRDGRIKTTSNLANPEKNL